MDLLIDDNLIVNLHFKDFSENKKIFHSFIRVNLFITGFISIGFDTIILITESFLCIHYFGHIIR